MAPAASATTPITTGTDVNVTTSSDPTPYNTRVISRDAPIAATMPISRVRCVAKLDLKVTEHGGRSGMGADHGFHRLTAVERRLRITRIRDHRSDSLMLCANSDTAIVVAGVSLTEHVVMDEHFLGANGKQQPS